MQWFRNRGVTTKLLLAFMAVTLVMSAVAVYALTGMRHVQENGETMYKDRLLPIVQANNARAATLRIRLGIYQHVSAQDASAMRAIETRIEEDDTVVDREIQA